MSGEHQPTVPQFRPLGAQLSSGRAVVLAVVSPLLWFGAFAGAAYVLGESDAIEYGLLIAGGAFVVSLVVLVLLRAARRREERRHVDGR